MEEIAEVHLNTWYIREGGKKDFFYCTKIEDKFVEGHGFINHEFDDFLHFERGLFESEWKICTGEFITDYFDEVNNPTTFL